MPSAIDFFYAVLPASRAPMSLAGLGEACLRLHGRSLESLCGRDGGGERVITQWLGRYARHFTLGPDGTVSRSGLSAMSLINCLPADRHIAVSLVDLKKRFLLRYGFDAVVHFGRPLVNVLREHPQLVHLHQDQHGPGLQVARVSHLVVSKDDLLLCLVAQQLMKVRSYLTSVLHTRFVRSNGFEFTHLSGGESLLAFVRRHPWIFRVSGEGARSSVELLEPCTYYPLGTCRRGDECTRTHNDIDLSMEVDVRELVPRVAAPAPAPAPVVARVATPPPQAVGSPEGVVAVEDDLRAFAAGLHAPVVSKHLVRLLLGVLRQTGGVRRDLIGREFYLHTGRTFCDLRPDALLRDFVTLIHKHQLVDIRESLDGDHPFVTARAC